MAGWIKLNRSLLDWEWYTDCTVKSLFIHCILEANHKPKTWRGIEIERGQFVTSVDGLKSKTGISSQSLRTALNKLKSTGEIAIKSTNRFTVISVINYDTYQSEDEPANKPANKQLTNNQQTTNKQLTTTKNDKNDKNEKNDKKEERASPPPVNILENLSEHLNNPEGAQAITTWLEHKRQIGKTYKPMGLKTFINQINKEYKNSAELMAAVNHSVMNNYQGLFRPKPQQTTKPEQSNYHPSRKAFRPSQETHRGSQRAKEIVSQTLATLTQKSSPRAT